MSTVMKDLLQRIYDREDKDASKRLEKAREEENRKANYSERNNVSDNNERRLPEREK